MTDVIVAGGGICGLLTALLLAKDGKEVIVLEADTAAPPSDTDAAWSGWERHVPQFHQTHNFHPLFRHILEAELPDVLEEMIAASCLRLDPLDWMPPTLSDRARMPGDDRFWTMTGRRPIVEACVARVAARDARIDIRRGNQIIGLVTASDQQRVPHVRGIRTETGEEILGDLVVDAMGRRSPIPRWLEDAGARPVTEDSDPWGFTYYTRYFVARDRKMPQMVGSALNHMGTFSILTFPADDDHYSITVFASSSDTPLKALRDTSRWSSLVQACPQQAHWLDGDAITDVLPMAGVVNRRRNFGDTEGPVATGVLPVGDAWASTNPSLGRGVSLGLKHALILRDVVRKQLGQPLALSCAWQEATAAELDPWYASQVAMDRVRFTEMELLRTGQEVPPPTHPQAQVQQAMMTARLFDPVVFRGSLEIMGCLARPEEVLGRPGMIERVLEAASSRERPPVPGPSREEILKLMG